MIKDMWLISYLYKNQEIIKSVAFDEIKKIKVVADKINFIEPI
ncbi:hypothetical protein OW763_08975 [Clostridium aestuarii]|uniref:Uncharacterized protein n=1 Tax=Clostridium aestuarii TaxID=338193 RepID=A0ABT4CZR7_9CLOT|nr:hypothetical protein [Clostridium aestuarii]MCY6484470.1 hypothetical protein [Clostridium aestuarii]